MNATPREPANVSNTIDFGDLFTAGAREAVPKALDKGLSLLFDYHGPVLHLRMADRALKESLQRLFGAAIDVLEDGFVFLTAEVSALPDARWVLKVAAASGGVFEPAATWREVLGRLQLTAVPGATAVQARDGTAKASVPGVPPQPFEGVCPYTGAVVRFVLDANEGALFSLDLEVDADPQAATDDLVEPDADGARAWLISDTAEASQATQRRLQRLGWATRTLGSVEEAAREMERMQPAYTRPSLVIAYESATLSLLRLRWLWALMPATTQVVLAVRPDSPSLDDSHAEHGISVHAWPFSPSELRSFTRRVAGGGANLVSGETLPAPLGFEQRRRALVVDDNAVNQMVAMGMLQVLGFEVETANDGLEAIDRCLALAPDLVLMDLHMPGMDGLEATRRLRMLQKQGTMPTFPIVAATADSTSEQACEQAGMDAHLPKPLNLAGLEQHLKRLLPTP